MVLSTGTEELWHLNWTTPKNQDGNNFTYMISTWITDKAGNAILPDDKARVLVEKDNTKPVAPPVLFVVTHAGRATGNAALPQILDEYNAVDYGTRKLLPINVDTDNAQYSGRADQFL